MFVAYPDRTIINIPTDPVRRRRIPAGGSDGALDRRRYSRDRSGETSPVDNERRGERPNGPDVFVRRRLCVTFIRRER
ncbi:hypothetical protein GCM10028856_25000 [Halopiger thermotolerans]